MSTERRPLAEWITLLVAALDADSVAGGRLRLVAAGGAAVIGLDEERVYVSFAPDGGLVVRPARPDDVVHGRGTATRAAVRDLLAARLDLHDAVTNGLVVVHGPARRATDLLHIIELLLDASARMPALRDHAAEVVAEAESPSPPAYPGPEAGRRAELEVLARLDLLHERRAEPARVGDL